MSSIAIKTGTVPNAQSDCRAVMELCDRQRNCCQTTPNGQGLDNPGNDRESGQTDIYTNTTLLGNCADKVIVEACRFFFGLSWDFGTIPAFNQCLLICTSNKTVLSVHQLRPQGNLVGDPVTAKLTTSDPNGQDGCIT